MPLLILLRTKSTQSFTFLLNVFSLTKIGAPFLQSLDSTQQKKVKEFIDVAGPRVGYALANIAIFACNSA